MIGDTTAPSASRAGRNENFLSPILFTVFSGYGKSCSGNRGQTVQIKIQQLKLSLYVLSRGRKTPPNPRSVRWTEKLSTGQPGHLFAVWSGRDDTLRWRSDLQNSGKIAERTDKVALPPRLRSKLVRKSARNHIF